MRKCICSLIMNFHALYIINSCQQQLVNTSSYDLIVRSWLSSPPQRTDPGTVYWASKLSHDCMHTDLDWPQVSTWGASSVAWKGLEMKSAFIFDWNQDAPSYPLGSWLTAKIHSFGESRFNHAIQRQNCTHVGTFWIYSLKLKAWK